jgi:hypothetical protein
MSDHKPSLLDKWFPRPGGKAIASKPLAQNFGEWTAKHAVKAIFVFGVDVLYAVTTGGYQISIPVFFNNFAWSMAALEAVSLTYTAVKALRRRARQGQPGLEIHFLAGVKPGDLGFETPDWAEDVPMPTEEESDGELPA